MRINNAAILATFFAGLGLSQASVANDAGEWQYEITPYLFAAGLDGTLGVRGHTTDIDVSFSDLLDDLDAGFMGLFTAQKGSWTLGLEGIYSKLEGEASHSVTGPGGIVSKNGRLDVTNSMYIYQGTVAYRLPHPTTQWDIFGAIRYTKISAELNVEVEFDPPAFSGSGGAKGSESWTDGVVGFRVMQPVSDKVSLMGYADIGGGGSDKTYQLMAGLNWAFNERFTAKLGYRYLSWDYEDDGSVWDMAMSGPYLGLGIQF